MRTVALIAVTLSACFDGPHADIDRSGALFKPDRILDVHVEMAPEDPGVQSGLIRISRSLFAFQIFAVVRPKAGLASLLHRSEISTGKRAS